MALSIGQLASITQNHIVPKVVEQLFGSNPLLFRLKAKGVKYTGGLTYRQPLAYAQTTAAGFFSGFGILNTAANDQLSSAEFSLRQAYAHVTVSGEEELKNSGKDAIVDLLETKKDMAVLTLEHKLGTALQGSNSAGNEIDGLLSLLSTSSTYAGITVADMSDWAAKLPALITANTLTKLDIQKLIGQCTVGADKPTVLVSNQSVFDKGWALWEGQQRFEDSAMADAGFQNLKVNGLPWVVDSHAPGSGFGSTDNYLEALNERYLSLLTHKDCDFKVVPVPPQKDQDVKMVRILWAGNLACSRRNMHGTYTVINPSL